MKKVLFALVAMLSLVAFDASAQGAMKFEESVIDYGTITRGANGEREFSFTNTGDKPVIITYAKGSCGCTVPKAPKTPILPGKSAKIKVKYDTNRKGSFVKNVTLTMKEPLAGATSANWATEKDFNRAFFNESNPKMVTLRIKGTVQDAAPGVAPAKAKNVFQKSAQ